jgi:hypothetical protein
MATVTDSNNNNVDSNAKDSASMTATRTIDDSDEDDMPRMCLAVVAVAAMSVVWGGAQWQQEVAASATLCQEIAAMVTFLQWAVQHRKI